MVGEGAQRAEPAVVLAVLVEAEGLVLQTADAGVQTAVAQVLMTRTIGDQTFYVVKLVFPRGDAASLMFGFDTEGKITGISLMSMAGD